MCEKKPVTDSTLEDKTETGVTCAGTTIFVGVTKADAISVGATKIRHHRCGSNKKQAPQVGEQQETGTTDGGSYEKQALQVG